MALLLNDHVLKGAGLLPPALTGKLSDFAGLIVAPVLVASAVRARATLPRLFAFGLVVGVFFAINVSHAAARAVEDAMALVRLVY